MFVFIVNNNGWYYMLAFSGGWILKDGFWEDAGEWVDSETWKDS